MREISLDIDGAASSYWRHSLMDGIGMIVDGTMALPSPCSANAMAVGKSRGSRTMLSVVFAAAAAASMRARIVVPRAIAMIGSRPSAFHRMLPFLEAAC
jgi:hypothetical protein